jgi:ATP-binding cassette subfamily A (ABC1) protein 3
MLIVGLIFWTLLGFYCEAVLPKEYGSKRHPCFMFFPSTYKGCCGGNVDDDMTEEERERRSTLLQKDSEDKDGMEVRNLKKENYEPVAAEVARSALDGQYLRIENLEKTYDNGFQAVNGINVKIYQNQIFALLGQNGAGKSTTIGVLTGLIDATKGTATAFNCDMFKEADKVRQFMGICPQHDILFDNLTPLEHLSVFYDFKGGDPALKDKEIADLIKDVGLTID